MRHRYITLIIIIAAAMCGSSRLSAQDYPPELKGKYGSTLKAAIRSAYRPTALIGESDLLDALKIIDSDGHGRVIDRYSAEVLLPEHTDGESGMFIDRVLPPVWWANTEPDYGDTINRDLHQIFACNAKVTGLKQDYPPGEVIAATFTNGCWSVGYGEIAGEKINAYMPAPEYRGDFARCVFYMATLYPVKMWNGLGINIFSDTEYPTLNRYSTNMLLQWHTSDPVDDKETARNNAIYSRQGNRNPFVQWPELADHVWGAKSQVPFGDQPETPPAVNAENLRAEYELSDTVYLHSPYIPDNAEWRADGNTVSGPYIPAKALGRGVHELRFATSELSGKIKITVK